MNTITWYECGTRRDREWNQMEWIGLEWIIRDIENIL